MNTKLLRQKILDLAIRGKLTEQKKSDGTTRELLARIAETRDERRETREFVKSSPASLNMSSPASLNMSSPAPTGDLAASSAKKKNAKSSAPKEIIPLDKSEASFEIPESWEWVKLGDLSEKIQYGYNAPAKDNGRIKMVRISDIHENSVDWDSVPYCDIEESEIPTYLLKKNDILFARTGGTVGKSFIVNEVPEESVYAGYLIRTRYGENIDAQYMKYFMESNLYWEQLRDGCIATAQPNCNGQTLGKMQIPLPPLAEQQRIVEAIENAFAEITAIENNQELLKKHIKQGRQKILDLAIRGKLTQQLKTDGTTMDLLKQIQDERTSEALQTRDERGAKSSRVILSKRSASKDLVKEIIPLDKSEAPFEIPESWEWVKLGDLSEKIQYGYNAPAKDNGRIKMVRISDIHENSVDWDSVPYCDIEESEIPTYLLKKNDILFARTGGTVGKSFIVNEVPEESVYAGYLIRTRYGENIDAQYMKYFMESNLYWEQLRDGCIATAQPNCNGQTLGKMQIPLPPLAEQQRIVATIQESFAEFDAMRICE